MHRPPDEYRGPVVAYRRRWSTRTGDQGGQRASGLFPGAAGDKAKPASRWARLNGVVGCAPLKSAPVAQLDRVPGYEPGGREFESLRARQIPKLVEFVGGLPTIERMRTPDRRRRRRGRLTTLASLRARLDARTSRACGPER